MGNNCKFIAIEGLDGSGKSTQIELLIKHLERNNERIKFVHFPRASQGVFGELISKFLRGEFGKLEQVHPQLVALLFAEDRKEFASTINEWMNDGYVVLVDRYVLSNVAFQCAKLDSESDKAYLRKWILEFEYDYNKIPQPDFTIYLDVPFDFVQQALAQRLISKDRAYLQGQDDIHEKSTELQVAVKKEYEALLMMEENNISKISCANAEGKMRFPADIHSDIVSVISERIATFNVRP
ncbi:dTMP kinase [uncultured Chitinophaga sp.]|uniref:dTMP kinase n=1 Tax=uncultured Chitinophaga sp. TaxID=339340 RepID=UPI0025FC100B|nr:dTMP kinase [uncultured Chitinophaga sp.]